MSDDATPPLPAPRGAPPRQRGVSMLELLIGLSLGLFVVATVTFLSAQRPLSATNQR